MYQNLINRFVGRKYFDIAKNWRGPAAIWGGCLGVAFLFGTDWKVIMGYVPYIRGKYEKED